MDEEKKFSIEDNINLDEIKMLLGDEPAPVRPDSVPEQTEIPPQEEKEQEPVPEEPKAQPAPAESKPELEAEPEKPQKKEKEKTSFAYELYGMLHDVIYLLMVVTLFFVFVIRLVGVKGESMLPTLHNKDFLLLESNFLYHGSDLKYGDVIVISVPYFEEQGEGPIVKRIIATEGQTVDIDFETGSVYVDGVLLQEDYINEPTYNNWQGEYGLEYPATVPEGCIFVLGDNRNNSMDSRYAPIGMIDEDDVLGKVLVIAMPGESRNEAGEVTDPRDWSRIGLVS